MWVTCMPLLPTLSSCCLITHASGTFLRHAWVPDFQLSCYKNATKEGKNPFVPLYIVPSVLLRKPEILSPGNWLGTFGLWMLKPVIGMPYAVFISHPMHLNKKRSTGILHCELVSMTSAHSQCVKLAALQTLMSEPALTICIHIWKEKCNWVYIAEGQMCMKGQKPWVCWTLSAPLTFWGLSAEIMVFLDETDRRLKC